MLSPQEQDSKKVEDTPTLLVLPSPMAAVGPSAAALPRELIEGICRDLSDLSYQFSPVLPSLPTIEKGIYISALWKRLLPLFKGTVRASIHKILPGEEREAQIETLVHRFEVSGSITVVFIHAELTDENSLALVSSEVEGLPPLLPLPLVQVLNSDRMRLHKCLERSLVPRSGDPG